MSRNISISEGSLARTFGPVPRVRVLTPGGGTEDFVLESDKNLVSKEITQNGVYYAAFDNAYGFSQLHVKCDDEAESITGMGEDGEPYTVTRDAEGNIVITPVGE